MAIEKGNRIAILALTRGGVRLAVTLGRQLGNAQLIVPKRLEREEHTQEAIFFDDWHSAARDAFREFSQLVFIMATGIVVRTIAPVLKSKLTDPAVVVVDENGSFAISLLSGHLGGANRLAKKVAELLKGTPVITTATDVNGVPALDNLAADLDCQVFPQAMLKVFNRLLVEGESIYLYSQWPLKVELGRGLAYIPGSLALVERGPGVYITNKVIHHSPGKRLMLRPCNLVAGVGCRKGVSKEQVVSAIKSTFRRGGFSLLSLKCLATVDIKMQEKGLLQAAEYFKVPLLEVNREQIENLTGQYNPSEFVKETIGVGGVCEPAAMTVSGMGLIKVPKQKLGPVTVALAEAKLWWWD